MGDETMEYKVWTGSDGRFTATTIYDILWLNEAEGAYREQHLADYHNRRIPITCIFLFYSPNSQEVDIQDCIFIMFKKPFQDTPFAITLDLTT